MTERAVPSWPVWVMGFGALAVIAAAVGLYLGLGTRLLVPENLLRTGSITPATAPYLILAVIGVLVSAVGNVAYIVRGSTSPARAQQGYGSIGTILACLGFAIIVANVASLPIAALIARLQPGESLTTTPGGLVLSIVLLDGAFLATIYLRIVRPGVLSWKQIGFTTVDFWPRVGLGLGVGVVVIAVSAAIGAILQFFGVQQTQEQMFAGVKGATPEQFIGVLIAGAVIAPICEEAFFRGYVFTALSQRRGLMAGIVGSSVLFGVSHLNLQALVPILTIGVIFAVTYSRTRSLIPSIIAHAMNNALALAALYFASR